MKFFHFVPSGHEFMVQLVAQWARSSHPLGWKLLSHIPNFRGGKVNPKEKYFDTSGVEVVGATGVRVEDPLKW